MREEFLPIGTVVKLYGQSGMIMIIGLSSRHSANESHGYIGCSYPDGFTTVDHLVMFDYKQIETIHYYTLADKKKEITTSTSTDNLQKINIPTSTIRTSEI